VRCVLQGRIGLRTAANSRHTDRGFCGEYEVVARLGTKTATGRIRLTREGDTLRLTETR
jgi:hypothetical protein